MRYCAALLVTLLAAASVQAQSLADFARQERERQAHTKPAQVIIGTGSGAAPAGEAAPASQASTPKSDEQKKTTVDPVKEYNDRVDKLRDKVRILQDQETATQLQVNELNNQVYAPVVEPAVKDQALADAGAAQMKLAEIRKDLADARKELGDLQAQGPPKPPK